MGIDSGKKTMYSRKDISEATVSRIMDIMAVRKITQSQLVQMCCQEGFDISQPEVSKILSGKTKPTVYFLVALSRVLHVSAEELLGGDRQEPLLQLKSRNFAVAPGMDEEYRNILGDYYIYYETTDPYDDKIVSGRISFCKATDFCEARLCIYTGEYQDGKELVKDYIGQLVISPKMRAAYCCLCSQQLGELCFFVFRYRNFAVREMTCRLGIAVTMSSGELKLPTAHKLLLTRERLGIDMMESIIPYLRFQTEEIRITPEELCDIAEKYPEYKKHLEELLQIVRRKEELIIREADIRATDRKLSQVQVAQIKALLTRNSDALRNVNLDEGEDSQVFYLLMKLLLNERKGSIQFSEAGYQE